MFCVLDTLPCTSTRTCVVVLGASPVLQPNDPLCTVVQHAGEKRGEGAEGIRRASETGRERVVGGVPSIVNFASGLNFGHKHDMERPTREVRGLQ